MSASTTEMDLYLLVDESGSMHPRKNSVIGGVNELIQKQRRLNPEGCRVSLFFFSEEVREVYFQRPLAEVPSLTADDYQPDCMTALRDAMGHVVGKVNASAQQQQQEAVERTVLLVVMTDGEENASMAVSPQELQRLLVEFKGQVTYMGSNQDAILNGRNLGVTAEASLDYTDENMLEAMDSLGNAVGRIRSGAASTVQYTAYERERSSGSSGSHEQSSGGSVQTQVWGGSRLVEEFDKESGLMPTHTL